jgi:homoserine kinase
MGVLGAALSGSGPSVLVLLHPEGNAETTRENIAAFLCEKQLQAELILTSMETHGARDRRWIGRGNERRWPIPLP